MVQITHHLPYRAHKMIRIKQIRNCEKGFSLLEMIVVLSVLTILSTIGIASFSSGSKRATVETATNELISTLQLARSRAISQVKPENLMKCNGELRGYKVEINISGNRNEYDLAVVCEVPPNPPTTNSILTKTLPNNVTFNDGTTQTSFFFPILTGSVEGSGVVSVTGYDITKSISVDTVGGITIKNE
jgi:prepilin-type N-terminal cleavage/methylation domain-containing protein